MAKYLSKSLFISVVTSALLSSCINSKEPAIQRKYGYNADYYIGLQNLAQGQKEEAARLFNKALKKGTPLTAERSALEYAKIGNIQERVKKYRKLLHYFEDDKAVLLAAVTEFYKAHEYALVIDSTNTVDISTADNNLLSMRFESMLYKNDSRLTKEIYTWFTTRDITSDHKKFYTAYLLQIPVPEHSESSAASGTKKSSAALENESTDPSYKSKTAASIKISNVLYNIITFRITIYGKDYTAAAVMLPVMKDFVSDTLKTDKEIPPLLLSDIGKACLYSNVSWLTYADFFTSAAAKFKSRDDRISAFYSYFYAGRLLSKGNYYYTRSLNSLTAALKVAPEPENFDNALWYYLNIKLSVSAAETIPALQQYCSQWHDPYYFDDFFDSLSVLLFSNHEWNSFYNIFRIIDGYASDETVAKYAYIAARLAEEKLSTTASDPEIVKNLYKRALHSGSDVYYKIMSAAKLGLTGNGLEEVMYSTRINNNFQINSDAEQLLQGYADFGFPEKIYSEWAALSGYGKNGISLTQAVKLSQFLQACADSNDFHTFYPQALRIAARTTSFSDRIADKEALYQVYPRNFSSLVTGTGNRFHIEEYMLYSLIRSESFFDPDIQSHAGAVGLTQLMGTTAGDISKKIHHTDFDLTNPATNIEFGGYYLSEMIQRLDGSVIQAFFAYNGGLTRVRRWVRNARIEMGTKQFFPNDLFLETIPYTETREYGRKLAATCVMYGWLYYNKNPTDVINEIMK